MTSSGVELALPIGREVDKFLRKEGLYDKVLDWWKRKNAYPIIVLGASGTGKTALLRSLAGMNPHVRREDRTDDIKAVKAKLGDIYLELIDTPGEEDHESRRKEAFRELMKRKSVGIINVVSYGYHEGKAPLSDVVDDEKSVREEFISKRKEVELRLVEEWLGPLCGRGGVVSWVVTVVTKADLWWIEGPDQPVVSYYSKEPYAKHLLSNPDVAHSVRTFSALNHLFYGCVPMSGFYSDAKKEEDRAALIAHILGKASESTA